MFQELRIVIHMMILFINGWCNSLTDKSFSTIQCEMLVVKNIGESKLVSCDSD